MVVGLDLGPNPFGPLGTKEEDDSSSEESTPSGCRTSPTREADHTYTWDNFAEALRKPRNVSTDFGMDEDHEFGWSFSDHHATSSSRDPPAYPCKSVRGLAPEVGKPDLAKLLEQVHSFSAQWKEADTVYLFVDNRSLESHTQPKYWRLFSPWIRERCSWIGPLGERTQAAFIASSFDNGLHLVHYTWAGTFVLEAAVFLFPRINFILCDADCVPLALFEIGELRSLATQLARDKRRNADLGAVLLVSEPHAEINALWICV